MRNWLIATTMLSLALAGPAFAQDPAGDWKGVLDIPEAGAKLTVIFHIKKTADGFEVTGDSPDQGAFGLTGKAVETGPNLRLDFAAVDGGYTGKWDAAKNAYVGEWTQSGQSRKLDITKEAPKT